MIQCLALVGIAFLPTKFQEPEEPKIQLSLISKAIAPTALVKAVAIVEFAPGMHGYQNPPAHEFEIPVKVVSTSATRDFKVAYPKGTEIDFLGEKTLAYEGKVEIPLTFRAPAKIGSYFMSVEVSYQQCNDGSCFPPRTAKFKVPYKVIRPSAKP